MKVRIQDNAVRFRITLKELEEWQSGGRLDRSTRIPGTDGTSRAFRYSVSFSEQEPESSLNLEPYSIELVLCPADFAQLCRPEQEGVYIRREWTDECGTAHRFMAFVEKDRPGSTCTKPEAWIYEEIPGQTRVTRPIPPRGESS